MDIRITVSTAVEKDGKFLLLKRARKETFAGLWEFPSGRVEPEEKLLDAAIRELKEETGLSGRLEYRGYGERFTGNDHVVVHYFHTKATGEAEISHEHSAFQWKTKQEILAMQKVANPSDADGRIGTDVLGFFRISH